MFWIKLLPCYKQTWNILIIQTVVLSLCSYVSSIFSLKLPDVHWNKTNPMFKSSNNDHIVEVNLNDEINFVCPYYSQSLGLDPTLHEYYTIHRVTKPEYDACHIDVNSVPVAIINCNTPTKKLLYTLTFASFLPIPNALEFVKGETYYFISTSTGDMNGLSNSYRGACFNHNMKLTIKVCCDETSQGCVPSEVPGCCSCTIDNTTDPTPSTPKSSSTFSHHASSSTGTTTYSTTTPSTSKTSTTTRATTTITKNVTLNTNTVSSRTTRGKKPTTPGSTQPTKTSTSDGDINEVNKKFTTPNQKSLIGSACTHRHSTSLLFVGLLFSLKSLLAR